MPTRARSAPVEGSASHIWCAIKIRTHRAKRTPLGPPDRSPRVGRNAARPARGRPRLRVRRLRVIPAAGVGWRRCRANGLDYSAGLAGAHEQTLVARVPASLHQDRASLRPHRRDPFRRRALVRSLRRARSLWYNPSASPRDRLGDVPKPRTEFDRGRAGRPLSPRFERGSRAASQPADTRIAA